MNTRRTLPLLAVLLSLFALPAQANCTVKYKAKQDNPLRLVAGTASLPDAACGSKAAAAQALAPQLAAEGWTLLAITAIVAGN